jgi:26S proteasome regulatory subunit T2
MVTVMKLEKAPQETYADIGGLDQQIQEIKVFIHSFFFLV